MLLLVLRAELVGLEAIGTRYSFQGFAAVVPALKLACVVGRSRARDQLVHAIGATVNVAIERPELAVVALGGGDGWTVQRFYVRTWMSLGGVVGGPKLVQLAEVDAAGLMDKADDPVS